VRPLPARPFTTWSTRASAVALVVLSAAATGGAVALTGRSSSSAGGGAKTASPARLTVSGAYIPRPLLTDMAAAYFTVTNSGGTAARLTAVTSTLAAHATLHTTSRDTMEQVSSLPVPAGGRLNLAGGGDHVMLENLTHKPSVGDKVTLTLHFTHASRATVTVTVPVRPTTYTPEG
jgi:copper(I)-binding protein